MEHNIKCHISKHRITKIRLKYHSPSRQSYMLRLGFSIGSLLFRCHHNWNHPAFIFSFFQFGSHWWDLKTFYISPNTNNIPLSLRQLLLVRKQGLLIFAKWRLITAVGAVWHMSNIISRDVFTEDIHVCPLRWIVYTAVLFQEIEVSKIFLDSATIVLIRS